MFSCLLKRVLPFTLTFAVGATLGWLFHFQGGGARFVEMTTRLESRIAPFSYGHSCRMRSRYLVAETRPLVILFKPDAILPPELDSEQWSVGIISVRVTFGADGKVQRVEPVESPRFCGNAKEEKRDKREAAIWDAVERAARGIQFKPEMINSVPVTITKEVEIYVRTYDDVVESN